MSEVLQTDNEMGSAPIGKLIRSLSLPLVFSLLIQGLYGLVDSMFVAYIGENALTAISLCMSVQYLVVGAGTGISVGANSVLSRKLGEKEQTDVNRAAGNGLLVLWAASVLFVLFGLFVVPSFFQMQADIPEVIEMSISYGQIICVFGFASMHQTYMERLLSATGKTKFAMISMIVGAVINIILDPILIFGFGGLPAMGIAGAAYATVFAQMAAAVIGFLLNRKYNREIQWKKSSFQIEGTIIAEIIKVGIPVALSQCLISVLAFGMNAVLLPLSAVAPGIYVVYIRLQSFATMPATGISNALVSLLAYNYGAKKKERVKSILKAGVGWAVLFTLISVLIFQLFPKWLLAMFNASEDMLRVGIPAFRIISLGMPVMCFVWVLVSFLQAMGKGTPCFIVSAAQAVLLPGTAWLLGLSGSVIWVWASFPIVEVLRTLLTGYFVKKAWQEKITVIEEK